MKLLDDIIIIVLLRIGGCASSLFCEETQEGPIVQGCEYNTKTNNTIFLDTGSGPDRNVGCICTIVPHQNPTVLLLVSNNGITLYNHTIQIQDLILNKTVTKGPVSLKTEANLTMKSDGTGGVCVTISAEKRMITISCYAQQKTTAGSATTIDKNSKTSVTSTATTQHTEAFSTTHDLQDDYVGGINHLTGPIAGGVSGFFVLVVATTVIVIYCKRRRNASNRKESKGQHRHVDSANTDPDIYTTENPMYERADGYDRLPFLGGSSQVPPQNLNVRNSKLGKNDDIDSEYQYISDIEQVTRNQNNKIEAKLLKYSTETKQPRKEH